MSQNTKLIFPPEDTPIRGWFDHFELDGPSSKRLSALFDRLQLPLTWQGYRNLGNALIPVIRYARQHDVFPQTTWQQIDQAWTHLLSQTERQPEHYRYINPGPRDNPVAKFSDAPFLAALLQGYPADPNEDPVWQLRTLLVSILLAYPGTSIPKHVPDIAAEIRLVADRKKAGPRISLLQGLNVSITSSSDCGRLKQTIVERRKKFSSSSIEARFLLALEDLMNLAQPLWEMDKTVVIHQAETPSDDFTNEVNAEATPAAVEVHQAETVERISPPPLLPSELTQKQRRAGVSRWGIEVERSVWTYSALNPLESHALLTELERLSKDTPQGQRIALVIMLMLLTSRDVPDVMMLPLGLGAVLDRKGHYHHTLPALSNAFVPSPSLTSFYDDVRQDITLPLPARIRRLLHQCTKENAAGTLSDCLGWEVSTATVAVEEQLTALRSKGWPRITSTRVVNALAHVLSGQTHDPMVAYLLTRHVPDQALSDAYYADIRSSRLRHYFINAWQALVEEDDAFDGIPVSGPDFWFGHAALPEPTKLRECIERLISETTTELHAGDLVKQHNAYTSYCVLFLIHATAHRDVKDPFCDPAQLDEQHGACLINDKSVSAAHDWRLVCLPTIACEQVRAYRQHLLMLAQHLYRKNHHELASAIHTLGQDPFAAEKNEVQLPFFFYLAEDLTQTRSLTPETLKQQLAIVWPYELNMGRHLIATCLRDANLSAELTNVQIGHLDVYQQPFGQTSRWSPLETLSTLDAPLTLLLESQGWKVMEGMRGRQTARILPIKNTRLIHEVPEWGHHTRASVRDERSKADKDAVRAVLTQEAMETLQQDPKHFAELCHQLALTADGNVGTIYRRQRLLYRLLRWRVGQYQLPIFLPRKPRSWLVEATPFTEKTLLHYHQGVHLHDALAQYCHVTMQSSRASSVGHHHAMLIVVAAVWQGITRMDILQALLEGNFKLYGEDEHSWLEIFRQHKEETVLLWRWHLQGVAKAVFYGLSGFQKDTEVSLHSDAAVEQLVQILSGCGVKVGKGNVLSVLSGQARSYWALVLSGQQHAIQVGRLASQSLPLPAWCRLMTNKVLVRDPADEPMQQYATTWQTVSADKAALDQKIFTKRMNSCLHAAQEALARGNERRRTTQKKVLLDEIEKEFSTESLPPLASALVSWTRFLCINGTRFLQDVSFNTVKNYYSTVSSMLLPNAWQHELFKLDAIDYAQLYLTALSQKSSESKVHRRGRLIEFHVFLQHQWDTDKCAWSYLLDDDDEQLLSGNPNLISNAEYRHALSHLLANTHGNKRDYLVSAGVLILCYRYGLRIDEARTMLPQDLQLSSRDAPSCVIVHNTSYGNVKRPASVRLAPCFEILSVEEYKILERLRESASVLWNEFPGVGLFYNPSDIHSVIDDTLLRNVFHGVLRTVTGDDVTTHHLRHSYVHRQRCYQDTWQRGNTGFMTQCCTDLCDKTKRKTSISFQPVDTDSAHPFAVFSPGVGHAKDITTVSDYWHLSEIEHAECVRQSALAALSELSLAFLLQVSADSLRQRCRRAGIAPVNRLDILSHFSLNKHVSTLPAMQVYEPDNIPESTKIAQGQRVFDLVMVDRMCCALALHEGNISSLAQQFFWSVGDMEQLLNHAVTLERLSRYHAFRLAVHTPASLVTPDENDKAGQDRLQTDTSAVRRILDEVKSVDLRESRLVQQLVRTWPGAFEPKWEGWLFDDSKVLSDFVEGLRLFEIKPSQMCLCYPDMAGSLQPLSLETLKQNDFGSVEKSSLPNDRNEGYRRFGLKLVGSRWRQQTRRLQRCLFILSLWKKFVESC